MPQVTPQGAPPQGGPPAGPQQAASGPQLGQILQLMKVIAGASDALGKVFPAASPMVNAIQDQLQQVQAKVSETQSPAQPAAPPI